MSGDGDDIACLRQFYTSFPAAVADSEKWEPSAVTFDDAAWEEKCSRIIGTYRKKVEKKFLPQVVERIIETERRGGTLAEADVEARRTALLEMKTKKREKLMETLGVTAARSDSEEAAFMSEFRELMYSEIAKKYSADPREMTGAGAGTTEQEILNQQTKAAEAAKTAVELEASAAAKAADAARIEEEVAEAKEDLKIATAAESAVAEAEHRKLEAAEEETAAAAALEAHTAALEAEAHARAKEARLASADVAAATQESTTVETETTVAQAQAQALAAAEAVAQQQKAEAVAAAEAAKAEETAAAAARGARALEKLETPVKDQEMHAVETHQEEDPEACKVGINSSTKQPETATIDRPGASVGSTPQRDVDAELAAGKTLTTAVLEEQVRQWINAVRESQSQEAIGADAQLADALRSGVILCELLNAIRPEAAVKTSKSSFPAHQRENIGKFVEGCTVLGVPDAENFETADLYEGTNLMQVWRCVASLGKHTPGSYTGPAMTSEAEIRAEIDKAAADAKTQKAAEEIAAAEEPLRAGKVQAEEEDRAMAQARAAEEAAAAAAEPEPEPEPEPEQEPAAQVEPAAEAAAVATATALKLQQTEAAEVEGGVRSEDPAGTEPAETVADENTRLLNTDDVTTISEGVPPRRRWWCCVGTAAQPAAYAPTVGTEDS